MADEKRGGRTPSIHQGHRKRAKEEFLARGLNGVADHKALELLLFYAIPQGDVNPLAHELVDRFGGLDGVFHATYDQLMNVKGVGANTATLIQLVPALAGYYLERRADLGSQVKEPWQFQELLAPLFFGARDETAYLVCLDGKNKVIACRELGEGIVNEVTIVTRKVMEVALECNAAKVALAHNHVSGLAAPSGADAYATRELWQMLRKVGIDLIDHLIMADGELVSMAASGYFHSWQLEG